MEAVSLHTESSTVPAHAVALIIIEASDQLSHQRLRELVGSALPQLARFRCRLVGKPLGLGQPVWAEIDDYDPTSQIHSATVTAPGGRREFDMAFPKNACAQVTSIVVDVQFASGKLQERLQTPNGACPR